MNTVGVDPGTTVEASAWLVANGPRIVVRGNGQPHRFVDSDVLVIEQIVSQGQIRKQDSLYATCLTTGVIIGRWLSSTNNPKPVYLVPRRILMSQFGLAPTAGDSALAAHLVGLRIAEGKRDAAGHLRISMPGLTTTHGRAAYVASQFNWRDQANQRYLWRER